MSLKIAILGTRGVPNNYGGFEHFAAWLSRGLVQKGHQVTVYNSSKHPYQQKEWHGVRIIHCFDPEYIIGAPGQFVYDLNCILDTRKKNYDIILMLGYTSSAVWKFLYPKNSIIITNMDGLEWQRTKYSKRVRRFLKYAEKLAVQSSRHHIADSPVIKEYLDNTYHIKSKYIAYGAGLYPAADEKLLDGYALKKYQYFLLMARMEPENNIEMILDGYCLTGSEIKFIVIGNTSNGFGKYLVDKYKNESRVIFLGAIFDEQKVQSLMAFCSLYFHGHSAGGTNPSLLDAMAAKAPLAAHNNPFNRSILKDNALLFTNATDVCHLINSNQYVNEVHIKNNYTTIENEFTWDMIIDQYENYFLECHAAVHQYYPLKHEKSILYKGQY
jgi:glycosyltransferase involved in cell wall biosynthesis